MRVVSAAVQGASKGDRARWIGAALGLAAGYVVFGWLGLQLAHYQTNATLVWPPTGLALAALVLFGRRLWPGVFAGALAVNLLVDTPALPALGIALGNTAEALTGAFLLERVGRFHPAFARLRDVLVYAAFGVLACTLVSAGIGVASLAAGGLLEGKNAAEVFLTWWLGDVGGAALVGPTLLVGARGSPSWRALLEAPEAWAVLCLAGLGAVVAFGGVLGEGSLSGFAAFSPFPFLIWAGLRLGPRGAVLAAAIVASIATVGTALGHGPFAHQPAREGLLQLCGYGALLGSAAAILAAAVAERDAAEAARRALEEQMHRAQRLESLGLLAAGVAHDFNNVLTAIRFSGELARHCAEDGQDLDAPLEEIEHATERAAELCRQLLDYAGESVRREALQDLAELVSDARRLVKGSLSGSVALRVDLDEELPRVVGDASQIRQVLVNLILNAAEAIGSAPGTITVRTRVADVGAATLARAQIGVDAAPGPYVVIEVADDGPGMEADTLSRVLEPFFTTKTHGRGLGLASVAGIVAAHHGALAIESRPGAGSVFSVYLPRRGGASPVRPDPRAADARPARARALR